MSEQTNIAWCDSTVNFWSGCTKVSAGCANCYAETLSNRNLGNIGKWGKGAPRQLHESAFKLAVKLNKKPWVCDGCRHATALDSKREDLCGCDTTRHRRRIFSLSLGDWLDPEVPIEWLARMLDTLRQCDQVTWILCTKRPELWEDRMMEVFNTKQWPSVDFGAWIGQWSRGKIPPPNIILLASVENNYQHQRIIDFLKIPAACHGLSLEPLLGPVLLHQSYFTIQPTLKWLIIGGESGPGARPCNVEWIRSLVEQGKTAGVATFVKQLGAHPMRHLSTGIERLYFNHHNGGDINEWPADLRIQEFPKS